jgi:xanthine/uracil permease
VAGSDGGGDAPYTNARTAAGLGLLLLVFILYIADVLSPTFSVDSIQLGLILGTALLFLGVEAGKRLLR